MCCVSLGVAVATGAARMVPSRPALFATWGVMSVGSQDDLALSPLLVLPV